MVVKGKQNTSSQDIIPDINAYYNKLIVEIDRFRSRRNSSSIIGIFANITEKGLDQALVTTELNSIFPQESRCNAFYRMLGLPVVAPNGELYSPGFNPDANRDAAERQRQLTIANALLQEIGSVLNSRELYPKEIAVLFQQQNALASATAISSIYVRHFDKQFKSGLEPLDKDLQTFQIPERASVNNVFLNDKLGSLTTSKHILKPFVTDPRIEWTVAPAANRICAPFLTDKSKTQLSQGQFLKRPYIEQVLRTRISEGNKITVSVTQPESGQYLRDLISSIQSNKAIVDQTAIETLSNPLKTLQKSEIAVFEKFVRILESFVSELVKSINQIGKIRTQINWKPIPNINGPEFGCELNSPNRADTDNNKQIEQDIIKAELIKIISQTTLTEDSVVDLGEFAFSDSDYTPLSTTQHNYDFYDKQLSSRTKQRDESGNKANDLLRRIEIITGEFSGLGLLDIIAIQATLWIISPEALLGLIDLPAETRMIQDKKLSTNGITRKLGIDALTEFEKKLSGIYILMDTFYQNIIDANGVNNQ